MTDLLQMIYQHYTLTGVQTYYEGQAKPEEVRKARAEIKLFGPFVEYRVREEHTTFQVRIDLTIPLEGNVYTKTELVQRFVDQSRIHLADCSTLLGYQVHYRGAVEMVEFCTITFDYYKET